jgi:hypothetical protein
VRVLLASTPKMRSLLAHLQSESVPLLSTVRRLEHNPRFQSVGFDGMVLAKATSDGLMEFIPKLGNGMTRDEIPALDWWDQTVAIVNGVPLSRKVLIRVAADKDGGAHVDADLPAHYEQLLKGVWQDMRSGALIPDHHLLYLRQIGYEVLHSDGLQALTE